MCFNRRGHFNGLSVRYFIFCPDFNSGKLVEIRAFSVPVFQNVLYIRCRRQNKSFLIQQFFKNVGEVWASSPHLRSKSNCMIYCPLLQTTVLFAVPLKAAAKPLALRGQYERRLLVAKPPPAIHCRYCKIVDFAIEPSINCNKNLREDRKNRNCLQKSKGYNDRTRFQGQLRFPRQAGDVPQPCRTGFRWYF